MPFVDLDGHTRLLSDGLGFAHKMKTIADPEASGAVVVQPYGEP